MQKYITLVIKLIKLIFYKLIVVVHKIMTWLKFYVNNIKFKNFKTNGIPFVMVARGAYCKFGYNLKINNGLLGNPIGRPQPCLFFVDKNASLIIGNNVGISSIALVCHTSITIEENVKIGGGVCIYDTDFHSLDFKKRRDSNFDSLDTKSIPVIIKKNAFIGAHSTILKGVCIGENAIVGACSVVTKNIPPNEIWAGNPAKFIKKLTFS